MGLCFGEASMATGAMTFELLAFQNFTDVGFSIVGKFVW